jgi:hypothetical protein
MTKTTLFEISNFGHWDLFVIWCLEFGASIWLCPLRHALRAIFQVHA